MGKKFWWPPWAYENRPRAALTFGALAIVAALILSVKNGSWNSPSIVMFVAGCVLGIYGAIVMQLRREYRESSKWARRQAQEHESKKTR